MKFIGVFLNETKRLFREKGLILILLLMPLGFIFPIGMAYRTSTGETSEKGQPLLVIDRDGGKQAAELIKKLDENFIIERNLSGEVVSRYKLQADPDCAQPSPACDEKIARAQLKDSSRAVALLIPQGMSAAFDKSESSAVRLLYDPSGDINFVNQVEGVVKGATIAISLEKQVMQGKQDMRDLSAIGSDSIKNAVSDAASKPADTDPAMKYEAIQPSNYLARKPPNALQQTIPGYTVMFVFLVTTFMASWSIEEKKNGILRRLLSSPINTSSLFAGKLIFGLLLSLGQVLILFIGCSLLFGLSLGKDLLAFFLVSLALAATVTSLGMLAAATKFPSSAVGAPLVICALLGGCLFTPDFLPPLLRFIGYFVPHSWAMQAYQDLLVRGQGLPQVLPEIGALCGFAILFFAIAVWRYDPLD